MRGTAGRAMSAGTFCASVTSARSKPHVSLPSGGTLTLAPSKNRLDCVGVRSADANTELPATGAMNGDDPHITFSPPPRETQCRAVSTRFGAISVPVQMATELLLN